MVQGPKQAQTSAHCHKDIAKVAKELAGATYDMVMSDNLVYSTWKNQNPELVYNPKKLKLRFVSKNWGKHIEAARATMALALREPIDDQVKERIVEILALDSTLIRGRRNPAQVAGQILNKN